MQKSEFYKEFYKLPNENEIIYNHEVQHLELDKLVLKLTNKQSGNTQQQIGSPLKLTTKK